MSIQFRCKQSGNTVQFSDEYDIKTMRDDPSYEEVKPEWLEPKQEATEVKQRGRPKTRIQADPL